MYGTLPRNNIAIPYTEFQNLTGFKLKGGFFILENKYIHNSYYGKMFPVKRQNYSFQSKWGALKEEPVLSGILNFCKWQNSSYFNDSKI